MFGGFPDSSVGKESTCTKADPGLISGLGRSTGEGIGYPLQYSWASIVAQLVKNLPAMQETPVWFLVWEDHWRREKLLSPVFWLEEFHGLYSMGSRRVKHSWVTFTFTSKNKPHSYIWIICFGSYINFPK